VTSWSEELADRARTSVPIGAYADDHMLHYCFLEPGGPSAVSSRFDAAVPVQALGPAVPAFAWDEREMADERGVRFDGLADPRPFRARAGVMPEPVIAHGAGVMQVVVGPVHAGIIEPGRFTFSSGGETVVHLDAQLGYAYRGIERTLEGVLAVDAAPRVARICGSCTAARSHAYALALESLAGIRVSASTAFARLVLCELERIVNHLGDLSMSAAGAAWVPGFSRGMALKERAMRLCAFASGHRLLFDAIVPGGIGPNVLIDPDAIGGLLRELAEDAAKYVQELFENASLISRWRSAGIVSPEVAAAFGAVGPARRAVGDACDVRQIAPYGAYGHLQFALAGQRSGDVFARCAVKRDELFASFGLAARALLAIVDRAVERAPLAAFPRGIGRACTEGPRGMEFVAVHVDAAGCIERFHAISASYRNWPVVARAMEGNIIPDFPLINKSFNLCYACADR
jgi:Ni,Fe-hydrogenase III large subunit